MHPQKIVVTERSAPVTSITEHGTAESTAVCNSDEVVTGGGFVIIRNGDWFVRKTSASGNGWSILMEGVDLTFKAVAECAKLT